jgi:hypothetical protein
MVKDESNAATDSAKVETYARYFKASVDMIEYCTAVNDLPFKKGTTIGSALGYNLHDTLKPYFNIAYAVADLSTDINRRNYSAAINHAVYVYNQVVAKKHTQFKSDVNSLNKIPNDTTKFVELKKFAPSVFTNSSLTATSGLTDSINTAKDALAKLSIAANAKDSPTTTLSHLINYGAFMASVVTAKNSNEVEAAIETAALPVGSSRIKRVSAFNVSLNAYTGLFVGHEWIKGVEDKKAINIMGVTAPIGIAVSWRVPYKRSMTVSKNKSQGNSISIFASFIDIGAVTTYRFSNTDPADSVSKLPTIELKDIIAPGLFISWGLKGLPISLNAGYQSGPLLRHVSSDVNEIVNNHYQRVILSANIDIPLMNLYNRKYKREKQ